MQLAGDEALNVRHAPHPPSSLDAMTVLKEGINPNTVSLQSKISVLESMCIYLFRP